MLLLGLLSIIATLSASHKNRKEEFSRITKYELIHINPHSIPKETKIIEFDAFNQHYKVQLTINNDMIASNIRHSNIDPSTHKHQYFSSMTESCHYHGKVLNTDTQSIVALSLCNKRGIRGRITAFNDTLIIHPSAYYLDVNKDKQCDYTLSDELLVYTLSNFNGSHIQNNENTAETFSPDTIRNIPSKRRLYTARNPGYTEMLMITGPVRTRNYKEDYEDQWYQQLLADLTEMVNGVSAIYEGTDWGSDVGREGSIKVVFKELEVIEDFDGIYKSLKPDKLYTNCELTDDEYDDTDLCAINGQGWLGTIKSWIYNNKDVSTFDHAQFVSDMRFKWSRNGMSTSRTLGWGSVGALCSGSQSASDVSVVPDMGGNTAAIRTMAHELGHNYGMEHDGQSGAGAACAADAGLMGYSDGEGFSTCSITSMQQYFTKADGLTCIGTGWDTTSERVNNRFDLADLGIPITTDPTTASPSKSPTITGATLNPTPIPSVLPSKAPHAYVGCVRIDGLSAYHYDGVWIELEDLYNDKAVYSFTSSFTQSMKYLYFRDDVSLSGGSATPSWFIGSSIGSLSISIYCAETELLSCDGRFMTYESNGWIMQTSSNIDMDCSRSPTVSPTGRPTQNDETLNPSQWPTDLPTITPTKTGATVDPTQHPTVSPTLKPTEQTGAPSVIPTQSPLEPSGCVSIDGIDDTYYNGVWIELDDLYNDKAAYLYRNAYGDATYLYSRSDLRVNGESATPSWFIGSVVGSTSLNAYCPEEDLLACSGEFRRYLSTGWTIVTSSIIDTECSADAICSSYVCLLTGGIDGYNGEWEPKGCNGDYAYYQMEDEEKYLCYSPSYQRWILTDVLCSSDSDNLRALTYRQNTEVINGGGWFESDGTGSFAEIRGAMISECNAEYTIEDLSCLDNTIYEEELCVYSNNTVLWKGSKAFKRGTVCHNDEPVYLYIVYNRSSKAVHLDSVQSVYYLFYHKELKYSDSNETIGQWLISKNEMSVSSLALCENDNLLECRESSWKVQMVTFDDSVFDGLMFRSIDKYLRVENGVCSLDNGDESEAWKHELLDIRIIGCVLLGILVLIIVCLGYRKHQDNKKLKAIIGKSIDIGNEDDVEVNMYLAMKD